MATHKRPRASKKIQVWLSYDMGQAGYQELYSWLKGHEATECGNSTAHFLYERKKRTRICASLKKEIENAMSIAADTRMFIIYREVGGQLRAAWLYGNPKVNTPWDNAQPYIVP